MKLVQEFISTYGVTILYSVLTAIFGYLGIVAKNLYQKYINDKTKKDVVSTVVKAVEQLYQDLHGEEKLKKACDAVSEMLASKGISVTDIELRMLIESAVGEFNDAFNRDAKHTVLDDAPEYDLDSAHTEAVEN